MDAIPDTLNAGSIQNSSERSEKLSIARSQLISVLESKTDLVKNSASTQSSSHNNIDESEVLVTIVVTVFNENCYVQDAIKSLKQQTHTSFKAVIVDDASTNDVRAVALKAINNDPRFHLVQHLKNGGVNAARNTGLRICDTPFVTFLDADDILLRDSIERRLALFLKISDDRVAGVFNGLTPGPENLTADYTPSNRKWSGTVQTFMNTRGRCPFGMHAPLLRADILRQVGGFDESLRAGAEDWEMWQRVLRHGYVFHPVDMVGGVYRVRPGSRVRGAPQEHAEIGRSIIEAAYRELPTSDVFETAPYVFRKPLPHYQKESDFLPRFVNFASMSYIAGGDRFEWFCKNIPFEVWRYGRYDFDFKMESKSGLARFLSLDKSLAEELEPLLDSVAENIVSELDASARDFLSAQSQIASESRGPSVTLFANGLAQAKTIETVARQLRAQGIAPVLVSLEMLSGDQGVEDLWTDLGADFISYNTYLIRLPAFQPSANIVMRPYCSAVRDLLGGVPTIELQSLYGETSPPEANSPDKPDHLCAPSDAAGLMEEILSQPPGAQQSWPKKTVFGSTGILVDIEERADGAADLEKIRGLKDSYAGQRCFILGNGPSLNAVDFESLADEHVFAANGFYLMQQQNGFEPTFYVVSDPTIVKESHGSIAAMKADHRIFSSLIQGLLPEDDNTFFYLLNRGFYEPRGEHFCVPRFSMDPSVRIFCGQSVTLTSLQLAFYMGFTEAYLVGMDFHYEVPAADTVNGELIESAGSDPNHFSSNYVSKGMTWKVPHLDRVKMGYEFARDTYESAGRKIYNATAGGKLEVFERVAFEEITRVG